MAFTQTQVDQLEAEIAQARDAIKHGDKSVSYASLQERLALLDRMRRELTSASSRVLIHKAKFGRGDT